MRWAVIFLSISLAVLTGSSCNEFHRNRSHAHVSDESIRKGKLLAAQYCGGCHAVPDPSLLDAKSWEQGVLPQMGPMLGITAYGFQRYPAARNDRNLPADFYPGQPLISAVQWQHIIDYYTATAPDSLKVSHPIIPKDLRLFEAQEPVYRSALPLAAYTGINAVKKELRVYDMHAQNLLFFDAHLHLTDSFPVPGAVSDIVTADSGLAWVNMGDIYPNNAPLGSLQQAYFKQKKLLAPATIAAGLHRPVALQQADLDKDGRMDYIVASFGYMIGNLSWYQSLPNGSYKQHIIRPVAGAAQIYVTDDNKDGLPDLWVLFAQGDEGIRHYTNRGGGKLEEKTVLRFPPVWGSTSFELVDMDGDGDQDIVYTCGDNADYSMVLKPYHGVYVFLQEGGGFKQRYFFPQNGAFKARTLDFDGDGDQDIASVSFFADYARQPAEGFVFLENRGGFHFKAATVPQAAQGRWITLDAGDLNGDGRPDLVLGNMAKPGAVVRSAIDWKQGPLFLVLWNRSGKRR